MNDDRMHPPAGFPGQLPEPNPAAFTVPSVGNEVVMDGDTYIVDHMTVETSTHKDSAGRKRHHLKVHFLATFDDPGYADPLADLI
jgi:hypothetical protein